MSVSDKILLKQNIINFFSKKEEYRSLSNFWECKIIIQDGNTFEIRDYDSGECYFHGEKFYLIGERTINNEKRKKELIEYSKKFLSGNCDPDGAKVKKMGRNLILTEYELKLWDQLKIDVQKEICEYKFENYEQVRNDLRNSGNKILIHPALRCSEKKLRCNDLCGKAVINNGKIEVIGRNIIGKIWMELRDQL
jgi:predicted NAD-dependent protein-ADP-ribosyltransferase YbiA (DUF1768 family)